MVWWDMLFNVGCFIVLMMLILHKSYMWLMIGMDHPQTVRMAEAAVIARYYFCAVMQSFYKSSGEFYSVYDEKLDRNWDRDRCQKKYKYKILGVFYPPETEKMFVKDCYTLHRLLRSYRECIEFSGHHTQVPPVVLMSYFNKPIIALGSSIHSRSRILGAIHTVQQVTVHQDLRPLLTGNFSMSLNAIEYRETERGMETDLRACVYDEHGILVWEGTASGVNLKKTYKPGKRPPPPPDTSFKPYKEETVHANKNLGFKFAQATTDWQPQHLSKITARLVGFKKPIAHGLWTLAVAVERISRSESCYQHAYPLHIESKFLKPMELDSTALLQFEKPEGNKHMSRFKMVHKEKTGVPHLVGRMYVGAKDSENSFL